MNSFRGEFETYDSRDDERGGGDAQCGGGFTERDYADRYAAYRADARSDGVGRSHRNRFHGDSQKPHAQRHAYGAYNIRKRISETVRHFERRRPDNFKKPRSNQYQPVHIKIHIPLHRPASERTGPQQPSRNGRDCL